MFPDARLKIPLTDNEIDELDTILGSRRSGITSASGLEGFWTALVCTPEMIMPSEYLYMILEGEVDEDDLAFENEAETQRFFELIFRLQNDTRGELKRASGLQYITDKDIPYVPLFDEAEDGAPDGGNWARGFLAGTELRPEYWKVFKNRADDAANPLIGIVGLAFDGVNFDGEPVTYQMTPDERAEISLLMGFAAMDIYRTLNPDDVPAYAANTPWAPGDAPFMNSEPKVGRNDPCPCGSGKKYKKCCSGLKLV